MTVVKSALAKAKGSKKVATKKTVDKVGRTVVNTSTQDISSSKGTPTAFATSVYNKCKQIPRGRVSTYKDIAVALDRPRAFRAVGSALKRNPFAPIVPCHRVVASDRTLGGFFGSTDLSGSLLKKKRDMLAEETVTFEENGKVSESCLHTF
mmetsp:Transcript_17297/g.28922  ORF Transcript_17297/g.28922 Transcript_17297/m.28922 type:complete len:151 (-) Transcript_17297:427-879(-)